MSLTESELAGDVHESVVEACPLALLVLDADQRVWVWNPAAERLSGRAVEDMVNRRLDEAGVIPPEQRETVEAAHRDVVAGHRDLVRVEIECCHKDGSRVTTSMWGGPLRGRNGRPRGMVAVVEAAAEQQRRERERHEAHARFEAIFNHSNDAIFVLDPEADEFLDINPQACALLGYPREELLELRPSDIHAHDVAAMRGFAVRVLKEGASWTNELSCLDRHGQVVPCEISASRVELDGRWWVLAMVRDVRDRKRVEQELREAQARYRDLFEEAPYPYISTGTDGRVHMANRRTEELLGHDHQELVGMPVLDLYPPDSPDGRPKAKQLFDRFLAGEELFGEELQMRRVDGEPVWVSLSAKPQRDENGELVASRTILEDITARKRAEAALEAARDELEHANIELTHLAYGAAHDLAEPVRTVTAYGQLLARRYEGQLDDHADAALSFIVEAGTRLRQLVDGLRSYAHAGQQPPEVDEVDLGELVEEVRRSLAAAIAEAEARVVTADPLPTVRGDRGALAQLLQNLIGNALKHADPHQPPTVQISGEPTPQGWRVTVADDGPGIPADQRERIFEAFHRRDRASLGIGLTICRKIVEAHGGRIWVDSTPGEGTTFAFTLADPQPSPTASS